MQVITIHPPLPCAFSPANRDAATFESTCGACASQALIRPTAEGRWRLLPVCVDHLPLVLERPHIGGVANAS